ncbi:MAG TPA: M23 family metallopeptidase, partial [Kofleriaceae bacterium]|nr:M23 family metallopeptidase [Kofleriaceae bacterium]
GAAPVTPGLPARRSLARPIARGRVAVAFGAAREGRDGPTLASRGVDLACAAGDPVLAVADGVVRWSGPLAGAGAALVDHVAHGVRFTSLLAGLDPAALPVPGARLARAEPFARAAGAAVHLEVRVPVGAVAEPVDPAPLLQ